MWGISRLELRWTKPLWTFLHSFDLDILPFFNVEIETLKVTKL